MKNKNLSLKPVNLKLLPAKLAQKYSRHLVFGTIIFVLLIYIFVVFNINKLASAEPDPNQATTSPLTIPKVDQDTVDNIQLLEDNNPDIHTLFEHARNNPFQE